MQVWPVGISASNLGVYWPLWDVALLRRYGRSNAAYRLHFAANQSGCIRTCMEDQGQVSQLLEKGHLLSLMTVDSPVPLGDPVPELDISWPSDQPIERPEVITVERLVYEPPLANGNFIDILY